MKRALATIAILCGILGSQSASATNCVAYVKAVTGFSIMGDAWQWWGNARDVYERGYRPAPGAVMVFARTGHMHVGHVAVVRSVVNSREILIDQANWHHGRVDKNVSVRDLSASNDWSSVEVEWTKGTYGGNFPIHGFVYAPGTPLPSEPFHERQAPARVIEAAAHPSSAHVVLAGGRGQVPTIHAASTTQPAKAPAAKHGAVKTAIYRGGKAPAAIPAHPRSVESRF
jgi:hypothetical protein